MSETVITPKTYVAVFAALMVLTVTTVAADFVPLGPFHTFVGLAIAILKAVLVILFFMHIKYSTRLTKLVTVGAFFWLLILVSLTLADYMSRGWLDVPGR